MYPSLYALLRELKRAQLERSVTAGMITISQAISNHLNDALMEYENMEDEAMVRKIKQLTDREAAL